MLPLPMNSGPYIYDAESKKFVMRPTSELRRDPLPDLPDEPSLPSPRVKPQPSRDRRKLIVWLVSAGLFLVWLILLTLWTRQTSSRTRAPIILPASSSGELSREKLPK